MKKLEIEKTEPTFIISTFKTDIIKVGLVFSISNFSIAKTSLANNWRSFSSSYLALAMSLEEVIRGSHQRESSKGVIAESHPKKSTQGYHQRSIDLKFSIITLCIFSKRADEEGILLLVR